MKKRGRQSGADLSVVAALPQRLPPPTYLTGEQARLWRQVVGARPADYFGSEHEPLIVEYVRAASTGQMVAHLVNESGVFERANTAAGLRELNRLLGMQDRATRQLLSLAKALRITVQAIRRGDAAANRTLSRSRRPWEIGRDGDEGGDDPA